MTPPKYLSTDDQLDLFQEEHVLKYTGVQTLQALRLAEAKAALIQYRDLYPRGEDVVGLLKLADYLMAGSDHAKPL
jgi:hypothetical protein